MALIPTPDAVADDTLSKLQPAERNKDKSIAHYSIFFDGTRNQAKPDETMTNVRRLYLATIGDAENETMAAYIPGIGCKYAPPNEPEFAGLESDGGGKWNAAVGAGGKLRLQVALIYLKKLMTGGVWDKENCSKNDGKKCLTGSHMVKPKQLTLSLFGFSRGAALARAFACALLTDDHKTLLEERGLKRIDGGLEATNDKGETVSAQLNISFMGLFDTVASVGAGVLAGASHADWASNLAIPPAIGQCVHFVAAIETRPNFPVDSIRNEQGYRANDIEIVYPGAHADVGGGYKAGFQGRTQDIAKICLRQMYAYAINAQVPLLAFDEIPKAIKSEFTLSQSAAGDFNSYLDTLPTVCNALNYSLKTPLQPNSSELTEVILAHLAVWLNTVFYNEPALGSLSETCPQPDYALTRAAPYNTGTGEQCSEWREGEEQTEQKQADSMAAHQKRFHQYVKQLGGGYNAQRNRTNAQTTNTQYQEHFLQYVCLPKTYDWQKITSTKYDDNGRSEYVLKLSPHGSTMVHFFAFYVHMSVAHFFNGDLADPRTVLYDKQPMPLVSDKSAQNVASAKETSIPAMA